MKITIEIKNTSLYIYMAITKMILNSPKNNFKTAKIMVWAVLPVPKHN